MNSKSKFHQASIVRVVATNGLQTEQGEDQVGWQLGTEAVEVGGLLAGGPVEANSFHFYLSVF